MDYVLKKFLSSEMDKKTIEDFIFVQQSVFSSQPFTYDSFSQKFLKNIYGDSIIIIVYDEENKPIAARAFWRNDINGHLAYQPADTAVCKEHRRKGIFGLMTKAALEAIEPNAVIYNYPNSNSYPQYMKIGWKDYETQYARIFTPWNYRAEKKGIIDSDYLKWWIEPRLNDTYGCFKAFGRSYLVRSLNQHGRYLIFGELHAEDTGRFKRVFPSLVLYHSKSKPFYRRNAKIGCRIVCKTNPDNIRIPDWKTDVL